MQWSALAIAAKQRADIATKAALEAERERDAALKELERLQKQGRTDSAQDLQINGRAVEEISPLDIITVKEEDPGAPLLLGEVVEVAPQPKPPPKFSLPTELKGLNFFAGQRRFRQRRGLEGNGQYQQSLHRCHINMYIY